MDSNYIFPQPGGGGQTTNLRVGAHSPGWDPDHKGGTPITKVGPLPRVGPRSPGYDTFKKFIVFRYKIQKKRKNLYRAMPCNSKECQLSIDINYLSFDCMV